MWRESGFRRVALGEAGGVTAFESAASATASAFTSLSRTSCSSASDSS